MQIIRKIALNSACLLVIGGFSCFGNGACTPEPDMQGQLKVKSCQFFDFGTSPNRANETGPAINISSGTSDEFKLTLSNRGIVMTGDFTPKNFIESRVTRREPQRRSLNARAKERYEKLAKEIPMTVFYQTKDRGLCKKLPNEHPLEINVYFYCCEPGPNQESPCAVGSRYYTETVPSLNGTK